MRDNGHQLNIGSTVHCCEGTVKILDFLGEGGQGEVYKVSLAGRQYALKYYFADLCTPMFKTNLQYIIDNPVDSKSFAWPMFMVENGRQFGYIMPLLTSEYRDISEWIGGRFTTSLDTLVKACVNLCDAFRNLHAAGYSYKDISNSNVLFNPDNGDVVIVDNDNVTPNSKSTGVIGTNGFMAPELVSGDVKIPSRLTDLYSLSVLLFEILIGEHPLNGKKEYNMSMRDYDDDQILKALYGPDTACFIFKDDTDLNRYIELSEPSQVNAREMWKLYPDFLRQMFHSAFVEGIRDTHKRPQAYEWTGAFLRLLGMLYSCPNCGMRHIYDRMAFYRANGTPKCTSCGRNSSIARIKMGDSIVMISDGTTLYSGYFSPNAKNKLIPIITFHESYGRITFTNCTDIRVQHKGKEITKGATSFEMDMKDMITVNGVSYPIAK